MKNIARHRVLLVTATAAMLCSLAAVGTASADVVAITPSKDNSLFEQDGGASSGIGPTLYSGETGSDGSRRAVVAFDIAGQVPAGSTINAVTLTMNVTRSGPFSGNDTYSLHRLTADWGEGNSNAELQALPGLGAPAASGDATWTHRFFATDTWTTQGGDFAATPSAATVAPLLGATAWSSTAGMVADVQSWLDSPAVNSGWIVIGNEITTRTARRFDSRESLTPANRPTLTVDYTPLISQVSITPGKDNSLFEQDGGASSGIGPTLYSGETGSDGSRRAVVAFDIAGQVPAGSTINAVTLTMNVTRSGPFSGTDTYSLHRLTADWGEGNSNAELQALPGLGAPAASGDATWSHRFFPTQTWNTLGGDFALTPSGATVAPLLGTTTWSSTPGMVADVQSWLDSPAGNAGWIIIGNEITTRTARRFDSRESPAPANRPTLTIDFTGSSGNTVGAVPDGDAVPGTQLLLDKLEDDMLQLSWGTSCVNSDTDYAIHEGLLGTYYSHAFKSCSTTGAQTQNLTPILADTYYLVLPTNATNEGSYGTDSAGAERPPGTTVCFPQSIGDPVCP